MSKLAGWERPINAKKHHYFKAGEITSLCGKWMFYGTVREPDTFESPDDCKACRSALKKENQSETK